MTDAAPSPATRPARGLLRVAVAQPRVVPGDLAACARAHADLVRSADADLVVFPELSLTGYDLDAPAVPPGYAELAPLLQACVATASTALVGAPVQEGARASIAVLRVDAAGIRVVYRKSHPGAAEAARFSPGPGPAVTTVHGWRVGLGVCRDTGVEEHLQRTVDLGIDLYAAGVVHHPHELAVQDERARAMARRSGAPVATAGLAGPTGGGYTSTAGGSSVWSADGELVARAGTEVGDLALAVLHPR